MIGGFARRVMLLTYAGILGKWGRVGVLRSMGRKYLSGNSCGSFCGKVVIKAATPDLPSLYSCCSHGRSCHKRSHPLPGPEAKPKGPSSVQSWTSSLHLCKSVASGTSF